MEEECKDIDFKEIEEEVKERVHDSDMIEEWLAEGNEPEQLKDYVPSRPKTDSINSGRPPKNKTFVHDKVYQTGKRSGEPK